MKDANMTVAGSSRDQAATIGNILVDTALSQGCAVFAWHEDEPQCVGERNYHHIRISDMPADGPFFQADVLADIESTGQWAVTPLDDIDSSGMKDFPTKDRIENHRLVTFLENQESRFGRLAWQIEYAIAPVYSAIEDRIKKTKTKTARQRARIAWSAEDIFLPCLADTPVVIVLGQRPGPACSERPRAHMDDYLLGICAGKGKTARMVLMPQNAEDAFYKTILSFQLADMHRAPVIISAEPMVVESLFSIGEIDPWRQSLFAYLSDPEKIKCRVTNDNLSLKQIPLTKV
jgi:hypothetical protein